MTKEVFSPSFKSRMREHLVKDILDIEIQQTYDKFGPISDENAAQNQSQRVVGFYYLGQTYDSPGNWKAWAKRIPLLESLYDKADKVIEELTELEKNKVAIKKLITSALFKSKSVGDIFALLPDSYHPTIAGAIVDYEPGSEPTLSKEEINQFLTKNEPVLESFREYLMLRLLMN